METFGDLLRSWRGDLSHRQLGTRASLSPGHVGDLESGRRAPSVSVAASLDLALGAQGALIRAGAEMRAIKKKQKEAQRKETQSRVAQEEETTNRRELFGFLGASLAVNGIAGLDKLAERVSLENLRHGINRSWRSGLDVDDWREIAQEYGRTYPATEPRELLDSLIVDLHGLQLAVQQCRDEITQRELQRVTALLSAFTAQTVANLGGLRESWRWWRTARDMADESRDRYTILWIRGREIVRAGYEQRSSVSILGLIDEAESRLGHDLPIAAMPFLAGKAQSLALMGNEAKKDAEDTLSRLRKASDALQFSAVPGDEAIFTWGEERVRFTESLTYTYLGDYPRAKVAQDRALELYPVDDLRSPAQIELQRAMCLVGMGDTSQGLQHAQMVATSLPAADRIRPVADLAQKILRSVPAIDRRQASVTEYREFLGALNAPMPRLTT